MKFRKSDYLEKDPRLNDSLYPVFSPYEKEWKWDEKQQQLVDVGLVNTQELVQSFENCALSKIFDKFVTDNDVRLALGIETIPEFTDDEPVDASSFKLDLASVGNVMDLAEDFRERYGLSYDMPYGKVFDYVQKHAQSNLEEIEKRVKSFRTSGKSSGSDNQPVNSSFDNNSNVKETSKQNNGGENK